MKDIFLALMTVLAFAANAAAQDVCARANKLLADGNTNEAKESYLELVRHGRAACAERALRVLATKQARVDKLLAIGEIQEAKEDLNGARSTYREALTLDPGSEAVTEKLAAVNGVAPAPSPTGELELQSAGALLRAGRYETAMSQLDDALKKNPALAVPPHFRTDPYQEARLLKSANLNTEAVEALKAAVKSGRPVPFDVLDLGPARAPWWEGVKRQFAPRADLFALLGAGLVLVAMYRYARSLRRRMRLEIPDFAPTESVSPQFAASVTAMVREAFTRFGPDHPKFSVATVRDTIQPLEIPDELLAAVPATLSPIVRLLPEVFQRIARGWVVVLDGRVHAPGRRGTGLTLSVVSDQVTVASITIWQHDFDPALVAATKAETSYEAADYYALAEPAAIWLLYTLEPLAKST